MGATTWSFPQAWLKWTTPLFFSMCVSHLQCKCMWKFFVLFVYCCHHKSKWRCWQEGGMIREEKHCPYELCMDQLTFGSPHPISPFSSIELLLWSSAKVEKSIHKHQFKPMFHRPLFVDDKWKRWFKGKEKKRSGALDYNPPPQLLPSWWYGANGPFQTNVGSNQRPCFCFGDMRYRQARFSFVIEWSYGINAHASLYNPLVKSG